MMNTNILIIGAGGHAKVLIDCLQQQNNTSILGILDINPACYGKNILGVEVLGHEDKLIEYSPSAVLLVNAIGSIDCPLKRKKVYQQLKQKGFQFATVIHPSASIATGVRLGEGCQIMAGSIIQPDCVIGHNTIINTGARVDHDTRIGEHVHIAPGAIIAGNVSIDNHCHIGIGSIIIQGITIEKDCLIAAGAVVLRDIPQGERVAGIPAKSIVKEDITNDNMEKYFS